MRVLPWAMALGSKIKERRESLGWSQADLADKVGSYQQQIDRIENGAFSRVLPKVLEALDMAGEPVTDARKPQIIPKAVPSPRGDLPVYASAQGGPGELLFSAEPIDYVGRGDPLASVRDGYAMYIVGDSMSPAYEQGDLALINPHLPPRPGLDVLVFREWEHEFAAVVKRMVRASTDEWHLEQFNPAKKFRLSRKEWPRCHVIVGKYSRR